MYCSLECRKKHEWAHEVECNKTKYYPKELQPTLGLQMKSFDIAGGVDEWQALIKGQKKTVFDFDLSNPKDPMYQKNLLVAINSLSKNFDNEICDLSDQDVVLDVPPINQKVRSKKRNLHLMRSIVEQKQILETNGIALTKQFKSDVYYVPGTQTITSYGTALLPFGSLFNHSCFPNVESVTINNKVVFYVARQITSGDQLFIYYGVCSISDSHKMRTETLKSYQFTCECIACAQKCQLDHLPSKDRKFREPDFRSCPPQEAIEQFKKNCRYIQSKPKSLCKEVATLMAHNAHLLHGVAKNSFDVFDA